jgi:hypothetical protein
MAESVNTYTGEQIVLSSGRLVFNSRTNDVFVSSRRYINLSAGDKVTIDVGIEDSDSEENMFLVNAPKMQLGLERYGVPEPIVKGEQLDDILNQLMDAITAYSEMVTTLAAVPPTLIVAEDFLKGRISIIKENIDNFKSQKSYTI